MTVNKKLQDKLKDDTLDLSCCDLEDVPVNQIAQIKKGTHLDLSNNQLYKLPDTFVILTHIVKLDLSKNYLEDLPENIGDLKQLKHLDLYSNKISRLPLSFGELKNLKWLDLKDNPLNELLAMLAGPCGDNKECQKCASAVIAYYGNVKIAVAQKKELAMAAAAVQERKREAKRRKKKKNASKENSNASTEKEADEPMKAELLMQNSEINEEQSETNEEEKITDDDSRDGVCSMFFQFLSTAIYTLLSLLIAFILVIMILPKFDEKRSDNLVKYLESYSGLPIKNYQNLGIKKLDSFVEYAGVMMNHTKILVRDTYQRHFGEELMDADDADL